MVEELKMLSEKASDYPERITLNGPKIPVELTQVGTKISFEATDLDGNQVKSEDLFKDHKVTMINLWGTFCTPCKYELPKLEEMNKELAEKDCQIIGIVSDALTEDGNIEKAKDMLSEAGVTYVNVVGTDEINALLTTNNYPTTYYVDSEGNVLKRRLLRRIWV